MTSTIALVCLTAFTAGLLLAFIFGGLHTRVQRIRRQLKALAYVLYAAQRWADAEQALRDYNAKQRALGYAFDESAHEASLNSDWTEQRLLEAIRAAKAEGLNLNLFAHLS
jgi:hypothetical protein